jgi:hypothetical protein
MNRYRRLEETMKDEGLTDQEVNFQKKFIFEILLFLF